MAEIVLHLYSTLATLPELPVGARVRGLDDPALRPHLRAIEAFVFRVAEGRPTRAQALTIEHLWRVQHQVTVVLPEASASSALPLAREINAVVLLPGGQVCNPRGELLIGPSVAEDAQPPYRVEGMARKARVLRELEAAGRAANAALPPVVSEREVVLRPVREVFARALGLAAVAVCAESVHSGAPVSAAQVRGPLPGARFTARESAFIDASRRDPREATQLVWRYEALGVLLWALGDVELPPPAGIGDAGDLVGRAMARARLGAPMGLRPTTEILDALDLHYRLHGYLRDRLHRGDPVEGLEPGVITERRTALSWLVQTGGFDWEEIPLPT